MARPVYVECEKIDVTEDFTDLGVFVLKKRNRHYYISNSVAHLQVSLPEISVPAAYAGTETVCWQGSFGHKIFKWINAEIDGKEIGRVWAQELNAAADSLPAEQVYGYNVLIGNVTPLVRPAARIHPLTLFVPVELYLKDFPMIMDLTFNVKFNRLEDLIITSSTSFRPVINNTIISALFLECTSGYEYQHAASKIVCSAIYSWRFTPVTRDSKRRRA